MSTALLSDAVNAASPAPILLFAVPVEDGIAFGKLGPDICFEVDATLKRLKQIHLARNHEAECERISAALQRNGAPKRGESAKTFQRLYYAYTRYGKDVGDVHYGPGNWRSIVNWSKVPARARANDDATEITALPPDFVHKFWRKLCERHQRVTSEAIRELVQIWQTGFDFEKRSYKELPGYQEWPKPEPDTGRPLGWTDRNLYRYTPDKFERIAARVGIQCASAVGLKLRFSRVGLKVLEQIQFDDHEFDAKVNFPGQDRSLRPRCFGSADVLTSIYDIVSKPTFWDASEEAKKALTETDFMWFVIRGLTDTGFRVDDAGTALCVEHGLAAIRGNKALPLGDALRDDFEQRIFDCTGHKVRVSRGGRFNQAAHGGQFAAPSGGNFRFKPLIELLWRLINDRLDSIPGQVGKDRLHAPEELERGEAYMKKLLIAATAMDPERAAHLILPRYTWDEFVHYSHEKLHTINVDTDHKLEGWSRCGFLLKEFRCSPDALDWHPIAALPEVLALPDQSDPSYSSLVSLRAQEALAINDPRKHCTRVRPMTRLEAFNREYQRDLKAGLIARLAPELIPALAGPRHSIKCNGSDCLTVRNGVFEFEDWRIDSDPIAYIAQTANGERLREGEKYVCYVNPMSPSLLVACQPNRANKSHHPIAVCPLMPNPSKNDISGIKASLGLQRTWYARALAQQRDRHAVDGRQLAFMRKHNAAILAGGKTEAEKQRSRTLRKAVLSCETLLDAEPATVGQSGSDQAAESPIEDRSASIDFDPSALL